MNGELRMCCQARKSCMDDFMKIVEEGDWMEHKREANFKLVARKNSLLTQFWFLESNAKIRPAVCPNCFGYVKEIMKACEPIEKIMEKEQKDKESEK